MQHFEPPAVKVAWHRKRNLARALPDLQTALLLPAEVIPVPGGQQTRIRQNELRENESESRGKLQRKWKQSVEREEMIWAFYNINLNLNLIYMV